MYVKDHFECVQIDLKLESDVECLVVKITLSNQMSFILVGIYRPPSADVTFLQVF